MTTVLTTQAQLRAHSHHLEGFAFKCGDCGLEKPLGGHGVSTGYGYYGPDKPDNAPICFECCGKRGRKDMVETGKTTLYLTQDSNSGPSLRLDGGRGHATLTNWPGTLRLPCYVKRGHHNIARVRYDVWFHFEGFVWHGVQYGDNTQLCRCKRTKERSR